MSAITATAQYTGTVSWSPANNPFLGSTVYTATITLTAKAGYTLTGVGANLLTVAGATSTTNLANSGLVTAVFPATGAAPPPPAAPTVTTQAVSSITTTSATGNGTVTDDGGSVILERGIVWNTGGNPTTADSKATTAGTMGAYTTSITGLTAGTLYHVRAYAINTIGYSYGSEVTFTTLALGAQTVATATGAGSASFSTSAGTITGLTAVAEGTLPTAGKPVGITFPFGFFSFNITGLSNGQTATVTITLPSDVPIGTQYWKYQGAWAQLLPPNFIYSGNVITLKLTDGGIGDADHLANGTIVDPGGPGVPPVPVPASSSLSVELMVAGLGSLMAFFMFRRVRRSQR